jgi:hypothetical protein
VRSFAYNSNPPSRPSACQRRDAQPKSPTPNWTIGAFSATTSPLLAKAPNRQGGRCCADGDEDETVITGANVPHRVRRHRDELPRPHGHLLAVDDDGAGAMDDGIHVLGSVADVVVPYGFPARWKLNLIEPECADPECLSDTFVVWARGRMRAWHRFHQAASAVV